MEDQKKIERISKIINHLNLEEKNVKKQFYGENCFGEKEKKEMEFLLENNQREHHQGKEPLKWNGWGYDDTEFLLNEKGQVYLSGNRYSLCGIPLPKLRIWAEQSFGLDINYKSPPNEIMNMGHFPIPIKNSTFLEEIQSHYLKLSFENKDRLFHAHGHTCEEIFKLRHGKFDRIPDVVIWPGKHEHVEEIIKSATKNNVVIIPYGGGTSVSLALECPENENRMIVSLDMHEMNRIKWIDYESLTCCIEAGIVGKDLDQKLSQLGFCMGHEPDSSEFSTLGGWIATRASGMKKNIYGNIEDLIIGIKIVTPTGTIEKKCKAPRVSTGPDIHHLILGSEGTIGVITEGIVKIRPLPEIKKYGSIVFPNFELGVACLREIAKERCAPASIRLMDNMQFQFGQVLKPESDSLSGEWLDMIKKWYVTSYKGFQIDKMVAATLLFEGNLVNVKQQEKKIFSIAAKYKGISGGEENGKRGYFLTYMIAYIRDFSFNYYFMAESFETSVSWSKVLELCNRVKARITNSCKEKGIIYNPLVTCRVTQVYDAGACVYFYFGFIYRGLKDPLETYSDIESQARDEILKCGGSLSHHHGVGKLRKKWMKETISPTGVNMLKGLKQTLDPNNIFANGNLI